MKIDLLTIGEFYHLDNQKNVTLVEIDKESAPPKARVLVWNEYVGKRGAMAGDRIRHTLLVEPKRLTRMSG